MLIPIKILTGAFRIKQLNILPLVIYMVHDNSFFGSTADFVIKKEHLGFLEELVISKRQSHRVKYDST